MKRPHVYILCSTPLEMALELPNALKTMKGNLMERRIERFAGKLGDRGHDFFRARISGMQRDMNTQVPNIIGRVIQAENQLSQVGNLTTVTTNENIRTVVRAAEPVKQFYKTFQPFPFMNMSNDDYNQLTGQYTQQRNLLLRYTRDPRNLAARLRENKAADTARNGFIATTRAFLQAAKQDLLSNRLNPAIPEHREAFHNLNLTPDERWLLVSRLNLANPEHREAFHNLNLTPIERGLLVERLNLANPEHREAFNELNLTSDERLLLVGRLELANPEHREAFHDLNLTPDERLLPVGRLELEIPEHREAFNELNLTPDERSPLVSRLKLEIPEHRKAFNELNLTPDERSPLVGHLDLKILKHREAFNELTVMTNER